MSYWLRNINKNLVFERHSIGCKVEMEPVIREEESRLELNAKMRWEEEILTNPPLFIFLEEI